MGKRLGGALLLVLGVTLSAWSAEDENGDLTTAPLQEPSMWQRFFSPRETKVPPPEEKEARATSPADRDELAPTAAPEKSALEVGLETEANAYWRRLDVADRLMQIAVATNDMDLLREAEKAQQRIFDIYRKRTSSLGGGATFAGMDEERLEKELQPGDADVQRLLKQQASSVSEQEPTAILRGRSR